LPALASPPRERAPADAGLADPARVLLERRHAPDVVGAQLRHVAGREVERRVASEVIPVLVIRGAAVPGVVLEEEVPLDVRIEASEVGETRGAGLAKGA